MGKRKAALTHTRISHDEATCLFLYIPVHNAHMGISLVSSMEMLPLLTLLLL
jgi:hypothetical protein